MEAKPNEHDAKPHEHNGIEDSSLLGLTAWDPSGLHMVDGIIYETPNDQKQQNTNRETQPQKPKRQITKTKKMK